jgi:hypothetical protein
MTEAVARAVESDILVAVASRSPQGRVAPTYTGGGGHDLKHAGAIFAGDLSSVKTRILLGCPSRRRIVTLRGPPRRGIPCTIGWSWIASNGLIPLDSDDPVPADFRANKDDK